MRFLTSEDIDWRFVEDIKALPGGEGIQHCLACGTCSMSCPIGKVDARFNPHRIIRMCVLGMRREVLESDFVWLCASCFTCQERCPQGVRISDIMTVLKNMAYKSGNIPAGVHAQRDLISRMGRIYEITDFDNKKRLKLNLPELPLECGDVHVLLEEAE